MHKGSKQWVFQCSTEVGDIRCFSRYCGKNNVTEDLFWPQFEHTVHCDREGMVTTLSDSFPHSILTQEVEISAVEKGNEVG